jgi:hypothetical protein
MERENFPLPFHQGEILSDQGLYLRTYDSSFDSRFVIKELKEPLHKKDAENTMLEMKAAYQKLKEIFNDKIPETIFTLIDVEPKKPHLKSRANIKIAQDKIIGTNPTPEILNQNPELKKEIIKMFEIAINHYIQTYDERTKKGEYIDIAGTNIVVGHTEFDKKIKPYFVDNHLPISRVSARPFLNCFIDDLYWLGISSPEIEHRIEQVSELERSLERK